MPIDPAALDAALNLARRNLLAERTSAGHWVGELSTSALSTATAIFTLHLHDKARSADAHAGLICAGLNWLRDHQNADGGWGDTIRSLSNISTTTLCWSAFACGEADYTDTIHRAEAWLKDAAGSLESAQLARAITARYGRDKTFSVPILTMAALARRLGSADQAWRLVPQLPFELAAAPHQLYAALRLPVVSYALPALIAIGQVRHALHPTRNPITRTLRNALVARTLALLETIQPSGGGFLEAAPLTSFVCMSLIAAGLHDHPVVSAGVEFLIRSIRADGSWPIDTNLATWVTTLSINALHADPEFALPEAQRRPLVEWLLNQQYTTEHPYTHVAPGGWAWTDLPGGVPDADDTPGALIALHHLAPRDPQVIQAAHGGINWLLDLQNRDGGMPTFCRGWTGLPFDRSGADLTAHALHAFAVWRGCCPPATARRIDRAIGKACDYLQRTCRGDGAWLPLWFGNQHGVDDENPVYGTARVMAGLAALGNHETAKGLRRSARRYLIGVQNGDGGWGGGGGVASSVEETALAAYALGDAGGGAEDVGGAYERGIAWLIDRVLSGELEPSPIGFYFARLWYFERLYPSVFAVQALSLAMGSLRSSLRAGSGRL